MHAIANEVLCEILPDNIDMVENVDEDEIVEVEMPQRENLKACSMFHERHYLLIYNDLW